MQLQPQTVSAFAPGVARPQSEPAVAAPARQPLLIDLPATVVLAAAFYAIALAASALLHVRANALDRIPLCIGPAAFLLFYTRLVFPRAVAVKQGIETAGLMVVLGLSLACLSYIGAMSSLPLRDPELIWADRHLGFDWLAIMGGLDHWPRVLMVLDGAYATFTSQIIATVLILLVARRTRELDRFLVTFVCATLIAVVISALVPTVGPMAALAGRTQFTHLATLGRATGETVLALRLGTLTTIELDAINGIISFPSLHAAVAVIVPFTLRWNKPLFWAFAVLDTVMFVSAVPSGNHYFCDVGGGVTVAALAIVCGRHVHERLDRLGAAALANIHAALQGRNARMTPAE